ncbi:MAG: UDP-N-acetylglucosamine-N-acetylmuramyl- (pentapeptide) pyrophosphoryl-undecaprenol N- acetylglucosamine transferase [candidate division TM6 bacterium GW2011_GWF2_30_66]|nr:MAG: UDP-N-acetylglucosamine-N-acetylmuramyl- (pentapeptide) pyrophosphoryl-undecaprenol N- acetylglucosamine transferase [candidate division TM6 bacterium GW2011_GWF2_30_66]
MNKQKNKNLLCFVAGKSGGHLIPAITIAQKLVSQDNDLKILFFSTNSSLDNKILQNNSIITDRVILSLENIPYKKSIINKIIGYPIFLTKLSGSFFKSFFKLLKNRPKKVISTGGYISVPVCLAAFCLRIPIELFELNTTPGKAIKFLSPFAKTINICFSKASSYLPQKKCNLTEYPIRFENNQISQNNFSFDSSASEKNLLKTKYLEKYGLCDKKFTLLILGGSQGSVSINNLILHVIKRNQNWSQNLQIIHQTGDKNNINLGIIYNSLGFTCHVFPFDDNIMQYYNIADLVICRSGAGSLFETLFFKKQCITIPLETTTTDHQIDNAIEIEKMYPDLVKMIRQQDGPIKLEKEIESKIRGF